MTFYTLFNHMISFVHRCLSIPVTLRMVILKSREKAAVLREQEIRAQQQQQQQHNDLYSYSASNSAIESSISSLFAPNLFSNMRQNSNGIKSEMNDSSDHSLAIQSHGPMQLNHLTSQNFTFDHQQQQAQGHNINAIAKAQGGKTNIPGNNIQTQLKQAAAAGLSNHTSPQRGLLNQKPNAMLLNMVSYFTSSIVFFSFFLCFSPSTCMSLTKHLLLFLSLFCLFFSPNPRSELFLLFFFPSSLHESMRPLVSIFIRLFTQTYDLCTDLTFDSHSQPSRSPIPTIVP